MSGTLSTLTSGLSALTSLFGGAAVRLDDFTFTEFEVPERMRWGGDHAGTLHKLIGGQRVLDKTGPDEAAIEWSGTLLGPFAKDRARALHALRQDGGPYSLDWIGDSYLVWVRSCRFDESHHQIRYDIACEIIPEDSGLDDDDLGPAGEVVDIKRQDAANLTMGGVLRNAGTFAAQGGAIFNSLTTAAQQVRSNGASLVGTIANVNALAGLANSRSLVGTALASAERAVSGTGLDTTTGFSQVLAGAKQMAGLSGIAGQLSRATMLLSG